MIRGNAVIHTSNILQARQERKLVNPEVFSDAKVDPSEPQSVHLALTVSGQALQTIPQVDALVFRPAIIIHCNRWEAGAIGENIYCFINPPGHTQLLLGMHLPNI